MPQIDLLPLCMLLAQNQRHRFMFLLYMQWAEMHGSSDSQLSGTCSHMWGTNIHHRS